MLHCPAVQREMENLEAKHKTLSRNIGPRLRRMRAIASLCREIGQKGYNFHAVGNKGLDEVPCNQGFYGVQGPRDSQAGGGS